MWSQKKRQRAIQTIIRYGEPHRSWLVHGGLATISVVLFRLAMPWPLRGVVEVAFPKGSHEGKLLIDYLPLWGDSVLWLSGFFLLLAFGLGISEMIQRVNIMKFAAHTVHDLRAAAVRGAIRRPLHERAASGDLITRIIGDSARIKAGLSGILVHVLQNGLLFLCICGVLLYISPQLGLIFLVAGLIALYIGLRASTPVADVTGKQRRKEGDYAVAIQEGLDYGGLDLQLEDLNWSSAQKEVRTTKLIALSSLLVHVVLAATVGLALWIGTQQVRAGMIAPGELFLFIAYALTVHRRMVQVGRQAARTGKVLACADRIGALLDDADSTTVLRPVTPICVPLVSGLHLEQIKLASVRDRNSKPRLRRTDLTIHPRSRIAVLGKIGAGKSSLLRLLAGVELPHQGKIFWDEEEVSNSDGTLLSRISYLPQDPVFPPTYIWKILGLSGPEVLLPEEQETLRQIGAWKVICSFPQGLAEKVSSHHVSRNEARVLVLAGILLGDASAVWVLDNPVQGLGGKEARRCLAEILKRAPERTLAIAFSEPIDLDRFDRVLLLRRGKIHFDGTPTEWDEWRRVRQ